MPNNTIQCLQISVFDKNIDGKSIHTSFQIAVATGEGARRTKQAGFNSLLFASPNFIATQPKYNKQHVCTCNTCTRVLYIHNLTNFDGWCIHPGNHHHRQDNEHTHYPHKFACLLAHIPRQPYVFCHSKLFCIFQNFT